MEMSGVLRSVLVAAIAVAAGASDEWECPEIAGEGLECSCELAHALRCTGDRTALPSLSARLRHGRAGRISLLDLTLSGVSVLPASFLEDVALQGLVVSTGELRRVDEAAFASCAAALQALGLPNNLLEAVPAAALAGLAGLERLDLSHNKLSSLEAGSFRGLANLTFLDLSYNALSQLSGQAFAALPGLKSLRLRGNRLGVSGLAALRALKSLEELDLSANLLAGPLSAELLPGLPRLRHLSLAENELKSVQQGALAGLKSLSSLSLSHNQIDVLEDHAFKQLSGLTRLELAYNDIVAVSSASLAHLDKLLNLELSHNYLRSLSADLVVPLRSLEELRLDDNDIAVVAGELPTSKLRLRRLSLADNPLNCDCDLLEFAGWLASSRLPESDKRSAVCATPPALENGLLAQLAAGGLLCPAEARGPSRRAPPSPPARLTLAEFHYEEATGVDMLWRVQPCAGARYTCDSLTVYGEDEVQVASSPIHCDSRLMPEPCLLPVSLPPGPKLRSGRRYRYCVLLMLPSGGHGELPGHGGCSELIGLEDAVHLVAEEPSRPGTRIAAVRANLSADGCLKVEVPLAGLASPADCGIELDVFAPQSGQVHRERLNCSSGAGTALAGLAPGRYRVCASLDDGQGPRNGRASCVEVRSASERTAGPGLLLLLLVPILVAGAGLALALGLFLLYRRGLLGRPAEHSTPRCCFVPSQQLDITRKAHYIKLLATTKV